MKTPAELGYKPEPKKPSLEETLEAAAEKAASSGTWEIAYDCMAMRSELDEADKILKAAGWTPVHGDYAMRDGKARYVPVGDERADRR